MSQKQLVPVNLYASAANPTTPTPAIGDMYYNTTTGVLIYNGTSWVAVGGGGGGASGDDDQIILGVQVFS